jgi:WD40 repeat protein
MAQTLQLYGPPIRSHALHTYRSAFVTMPSCLLLESLAREPDAASLPRLLSPRVEHLGRAARVLLGHQDEVLSVAYSNDGTRIVSGSADHTIRVWSTITFLELGKIEGHTHSVTSVVFTTDGTRIISSSKDCTVRVWSGVNLEHITTIEGHQDTVSSVAVSPDGTRIISGSHDGTIRVWCAANYSELERLKDHGPEVSSVAYSPNGSHIVSSWGDKVLVFDNIDFEVVAVLEAAVRSDKVSPGDFKSVTFSKDGSQIVAGSQDGTARIWNAANFEETSVLTRTGYHEGWKAVSSVALSSDGGLVIGGGGRSDCIYVWDARSCKEITRLQAHPENVVCMAFSPDSTRFVSGGADHALRVWVTGMYDNGDIASGDRPQIDCVAFSPDGARVMSRSKKDVSHRFNNLLIMPPNVQSYTVRIWTVEKFEELGQITGASEQFAFSPAGIQAVTVMTTGHVNIWSLLGFKQLASVMGSSYSYERILSLAYSPDGTRIVCGTRPGTIQSWSTVSFTKLAEFEAHSSQIKHVMFCSDGRLLFSGSSDGCIRVWNGTTLEKLEEIECRRDIQCMAVSPVGTYIVAALDDKTVIVGSVLSFHELVRLEHHSLLKHVAFSPDGRSVLTLDDHADTRAWTRSEGDDCA